MAVGGRGSFVMGWTVEVEIYQSGLWALQKIARELPAVCLARARGGPLHYLSRSVPVNKHCPQSQIK